VTEGATFELGRVAQRNAPLGPTPTVGASARVGPDPFELVALRPRGAPPETPCASID
jgi:hypothetical protein